MVVGGREKERKRREERYTKSKQTGRGWEKEKEKHLQRNDAGVDCLPKNNNSDKGERGGEKK